MGKDVSHEQFLDKLKIRNSKYRGGLFKVIGTYESAKTPLLIEDKYGRCLVTPDSLISKGVGATFSTAIDKISYAKNKLKDTNKGFRDGKFTIESEDIRLITDPIIVKDRYGLCTTTLRTLFQGQYPSATSTIDTQNYFLNMCKDRNIYVLRGDIFDIGEFKGMSTKITASTKYGDVLYYNAYNLLCNNAPSIMTAINKTEYFKNVLKEVNEYYAGGLFEIVSEYTKSVGTIDIKYDGFLFRTNPMSLLKNHFVDIRSCLDPVKYFVYKANKIHGDKYNYDKVVYINAKTPIIIGCPVHNDFLQTPDSHLGGSGCSKCPHNHPGTGYKLGDWEEAAHRSNYFDSYKMYIIECTLDEELFYKVGITFRELRHRINSRTIPYNVKIIKVYETETATDTYMLEKFAIKQHNKYKYKPKIEFPGWRMECFSEINIEQLDEWYQNSLKEL